MKNIPHESGSGRGGDLCFAAAAAGVMLDLEVVPERSLGNEQLEFILGMPFAQVHGFTVVA